MAGQDASLGAQPGLDLQKGGTICSFQPNTTGPAVQRREKQKQNEGESHRTADAGE